MQAYIDLVRNGAGRGPVAGGHPSGSKLTEWWPFKKNELAKWTKKILI